VLDKAAKLETASGSSYDAYEVASSGKYDYLDNLKDFDYGESEPDESNQAADRNRRQSTTPDMEFLTDFYGTNQYVGHRRKRRQALLLGAGGKVSFNFLNFRIFVF
jgi:hypothetical protein